MVIDQELYFERIIRAIITGVLLTAGYYKRKSAQTNGNKSDEGTFLTIIGTILALTLIF